MKMQIIPKEQFLKTFKILGWDSYVSADGKFIILNSKYFSDVWTVVPRDERSSEYIKYQEQNIDLILLSLGLEKNSQNFLKVYEQLLGFHYPIINRITSKTENFDQGVPINLAETLLNKIASSFISFRKSLNFSSEDNLRFGHTEHGSFILKILVPTSPEENKPLVESENYTRLEVREYLNQINKLSKIEEDNPIRYYDSITEEGISLKLVNDILGKNGVVEVVNKYRDIGEIEDLYLFSENNDVLEYNHPKSLDFPVIDLRYSKPLDEDFLKILEEEDKKLKVDEKDVDIMVTVFAINQNGTATFNIESINYGDSPQVKKGRTVKLTNNRISMCANALGDNQKLIVRGDILKQEGQGMAEVVVGDMKLYNQTDERNPLY